MSRIDDELAQAVRDADASKPAEKSGSAGSARSSAADEARPVVGDAAAHPQSKMRWGLLGALLALMGGILAIVFAGGQDAVVYSYQVSEVKAQAATLGERQVRVQGSLVSGTLVRRDNPCEYRFMMRKLNDKNGEALEVRYPLCVVPDTFRDVKGVEVEVTAEGRLAGDGHLQASKIFAKCPSKYEMRDNANKTGGKGPEHTAANDPSTGDPTASNGQSEFIPARVEQGIR
jgi:cytochrome c-type biogenesis protein CcmE